MNVRSQGELAVGLLGVWAMLQALASLINVAGILLATDRQTAFSPLLLAISVPAVLMLAIGYLMVRHNAAVVSFLFPSIGAVAELDSLELPVVLVGCVGLLLIGSAVPALIRTVLLYSSQARMGPPVARVLDQRAAIAYVVQAVFGLLLVLRPRRVISLWRR